MEATSLPAFKDRSTGLVIFGILTILMGCLAGLMILLMLVGMVAAAKTQNPPPPASTLVWVVLIYGGLAVALIWLGIGSIMARRWARALLLIFSWVWLLMGIISMISMGFFLPKMLENAPATNGPPAMPTAAITGVIVVMFLFFGFFSLSCCRRLGYSFTTAGT
jgi:hypothetical protein